MVYLYRFPQKIRLDMRCGRKLYDFNINRTYLFVNGFFSLNFFLLHPLMSPQYTAARLTVSFL